MTLFDPLSQSQLSAAIDETVENVLLKQSPERQQEKAIAPVARDTSEWRVNQATANNSEHRQHAVGKSSKRQAARKLSTRKPNLSQFSPRSRWEKIIKPSARERERRRPTCFLPANDSTTHSASRHDVTTDAISQRARRSILAPPSIGTQASAFDGSTFRSYSMGCFTIFPSSSTKKRNWVTQKLQ